MHRPQVIAEIGCAHLGSLDRAKHLIKLAYFCGADYVKTQKRNPAESTPKELWDKPHPNELFSYGKTYLEHRINLELNIIEHIHMARYCDELGIGYSTSVWDVTSANEIVHQINPTFIKVPSPCNNNSKMLRVLLDDYQGGVHISTGMSERQEIEKLIETVALFGDRIVMYHCTSEYPCPFEHLYLREIEWLGERLEGTGIQVGFSNHGYGIAADIAAMVLGADWIERHFVDDRTTKHTDSAASLEPEGLRKLSRDLKNVTKALQYSEGITSEEALQRRKLRGDKSISD